MNMLLRIADKAGSLGAVVATMGCAMCFPAIAGLGAAIGLGFLARWEWLFVNTLLPLFAWVVLIANVLAWFNHRQLLSLYPWFRYGWSTYVTYAVSLWDLFWPANRRSMP